MARKQRIGFIGAGGIAIGHYQRLLPVKKAQVVALNEPSKASLKKFCQQCEGAGALPVYDDYKEMLKQEELDAVIVLSPHTVHYEQINAALNRGLHVLTEKPMVCTTPHAKALIKKAKAKERVLMISYQRHYEPTFRYIRDRIASGKVGEVQYVQAIQSQEWLQLTRGTWRQDPALSGGGQLNDSGSHLVDIVMWMTGMKVREVFATTEYFGTRVDINASLTMKFANGALGSMSVIGNAPGFYEDHSIVCSKGAFYLRHGTGLIQQNAKGKPVKVKLPRYKKDPDSDFVDCILQGKEPQVPPECGLRVIEVTESAWKSAESGEPVRVR